jgi:hypothetical protein
VPNRKSVATAALEHFVTMAPRDGAVAAIDRVVGANPGILGAMTLVAVRLGDSIDLYRGVRCR